jgi:hypothetical protein
MAPGAPARGGLRAGAGGGEAGPKREAGPRILLTKSVEGPR